jgi:hypothetical protein
MDRRCSVQPDVILRSRGGFELDCGTDNEGNSLGFGFANDLGGASAALSAMHQFVCYLVDEGCKLFG